MEYIPDINRIANSSATIIIFDKHSELRNYSARQNERIVHSMQQLTQELNYFMRSHK